MELNFTRQYKNPLFYWKCKYYAAVGYIFLKKYFKTIKDKICMIKMKSHIFKEDGIHYYLEVSIGKRKFIIDNSLFFFFRIFKITRIKMTTLFSR